VATCEDTSLPVNFIQSTIPRPRRDKRWLSLPRLHMPLLESRDKGDDSRGVLLIMVSHSLKEGCISAEVPVYP
jgi:hypothetical protein